MQELRRELQFVSVFALLFLGLGSLVLFQTVSANEAGTNSRTISHEPDQALTLHSSSDRNVAGAEEYVSPEFTTAFTFNGVGLTWADNSETPSDDVHFALKIDDGAWIDVEMVIDEGKDGSEPYTSMPVFATGSRLQYKITGSDAAQVRNVRLIYFDSTIAPEPSMLQGFLRKPSSNGINVISRSEWGANESYRSWDSEYTTPQAFVIHHTAGTDGGNDPAATVRGIYYWHAIVLGWGDIGYNYIIDQQGNIYEGRYGGNGVIGAHAYNSSNQRNYNRNTVGIALMGCFESTPGACPTTHTFNDAMKNSLTSLLAVKSKALNIDPLGTTNLFGETKKTIISHRDIDYTYCPGDLVHSKLKSIRNLTNSKRSELSTSGPRLQATKLQSLQNGSYTTGTMPQLQVTYQNTGSDTWDGGVVAMQVRVLGSPTKQRVLLPTTVTTGQQVTIPFTWEQMPTEPGTYTITTRLYKNGKIIKKSKAKATVVVNQ